MTILKHDIKGVFLVCGLVGFICLSVFVLNTKVVGLYSHFKLMFGPVTPVLIALAVLFLASVFRLVFETQDTDPPEAPLMIVHYASPAIGLVGTIIAIQSAFKGLNLGSLELATAINKIFMTLGVSLSTTVFGMILGLCALIVRIMFRDRLNANRSANDSGQAQLEN